MSTLLQPGDILPSRQLPPLAGGAPVRIGQNRRRAQVLVVTHAEPCEQCSAYVASFEAVGDRLAAEKADVVAVVGPAWQHDTTSTPTPAPAVIDDGVIGTSLSPEHTPVVAVADRFGQLFEVFDAGPDHRFPGHEDVLGTLLHIAIACPECGVPDVPNGMMLPEMGTSSGGMRLGD